MATDTLIQLAHDDVGTGDPAVVLMHGLFADRTYFSSQVDHLRGAHRVINVDLRGHGASEVPETGYSIDALAGDVIRLCDEAGVGRAVFVSHSVATALRIAIRRPDLAAGVVLVDGALLRLPPAAAGMNQLVQALGTDGWREALLGFFVHSGRAGAAADRVAADIARMPSVFAAPMLQDIIEAETSGRDAQELSALVCPLLYVHCSVPADLGRLKELQPDVLIESLPGVGHYPMIAAPEELNAALDRFLEVVGQT